MTPVAPMRTIRNLRESKQSSGVRAALKTLLTADASGLGLRVSREDKGYLDVIQFRSIDAIPFACIVNAGSLLFYVRLPGQRLFPSICAGIRSNFSELVVTPRGEWTIRLANATDAARLMSMLTGDVPSGQAHEKVAAHMKIRRPAARVEQGSLLLYSTSLRVGDLLVPGFYDIERLDPDDPSSAGYQRVLNHGRAKKLADYLLDGLKSGDAFLPTSVFLATDKEIDFDATNNTIEFDTRLVGPFSVVDGQHRLEGLRLAADRDPSIRDFEIPANIGVRLPKIAQMCHFLIVNTTQKSVDRSVEQRIFARLTHDLEFEDVPTLPKWIRRIVESGDDQEALSLADYLNENDSSPWKGKIEMANEDVKSSTINQRTFVKLTKRYVLAASNPASAYDRERRNRMLLNYWTAVASLLDAGKPTVLFKNNGVSLFMRFSAPFLTKLANTGDFKVDTMKSALQRCFSAMDGEHAGVGHPDWWLSGTGSASALNEAALGKIFPELTKALYRSDNGPEEIQL